MNGLQTTADIKLPKSRNSVALTGYRVSAIAKSVSTKTTDVGWMIYRTNLDTGDVDYAKKNGVPSDDYVFTAIDEDDINSHFSAYTE